MTDHRLERSKFSRQDHWIALGLLILAVALRLPFQFSSGFVVDEFYTANYSAERAFRLLNPMYYLLALTASDLLGDSEGVFRLPAFVIGCISIPAFYYLFSRIIGRPGAVIAALLISISGWHLFHSINARFYTGIFLFGGLSAGFYLLMLIRPQYRWFVAHLATIGIAISFHATALVMAGACGLVSLILALRPKIPGLTPAAVKIARIHVGIGAAIGLAAIPFAINTMESWVSSGQSWGRTGLGLLLQLTNKIGPASLIASAFGWVLLTQRKPVLGLAFAIIIAFPVLVFTLISDVAAVRADYVFYAAPLFFVLAGSFCGASLRQDVPSRWTTWGAASILVAASLPGMISHYSTRASYDTLDPIVFIRNVEMSGDSVVAMTEGFGYYGVQAPLNPFPESPFDSRADWKAILAAESETADRTWIVVPVRRSDIAEPLKEVLACTASLEWRRFARRFDYSSFGAEVYLIDWRDPDIEACIR